MSDYVTVEIPIRRLPDGRKFVALVDVYGRPDVSDFVKQFSNYWQWDQKRLGFVGPVEN